MGKINQQGLSSFANPQKVPEQPVEKVTEHIVKEATISKKPSRVEMRREMLDEVKKSVDTLNELGLKALSNQIIGLVNRTTQSRFIVSFVGEFNHGKSSLVNKILGMDILPVGDLPTTALLTRVTYSEKEEITALDSNAKVSKTFPLAEESWQELVAYDEDGNEALDREKYRGIVAGVNNEWLRKIGVDIFDTPGSNDGNKERDMEISRAVMATDGAVFCVDATKGLMMSQKTFLKDRVMGVKVPNVAVAITHLDLIEENNRDKQVLYILASLKGIGIEVPVVITNDVKMPSDKFASIIGIDKLMRLIATWSADPDRADKMETWLAANVCRVLDFAKSALENQKQILETKGEERDKIITEQKSSIVKMHKQWDELRNELQERLKGCIEKFNIAKRNKVDEVVDYFVNRIESHPNPAEWYEKNYVYELTKQLKDSNKALDYVVTEKARNDFEWLNQVIQTQFKAFAKRDGQNWENSEIGQIFVPKDNTLSPNIAKEREKSGYKASIGMIIGSLIFSFISVPIGIAGNPIIVNQIARCSCLGTIGVGTLMRYLSGKKLQEKGEKARQQLINLVKKEVPNVMENATANCADRISILYNDMLRAAFSTEASWMNVQYALIDKAALPAVDAEGKAISEVQSKIGRIESLTNNIQKYIR